jgi:hypothetical protein
MYTKEYGVLTTVTLESLGPSFCLAWAFFLTPYTHILDLAAADVNITKLSTPNHKKNSLPFSSGIVCTCIQKKLDRKNPDHAD